MADDAKLIHFADVWKSFGTVNAVAGLSFELVAGRTLGLLGHNGAGKTTSIRMILDILKPDKGEIRVLGRTVDPSVKDRIGYLPEERGLYKKMRVEDLLVFFGSVNGMPRPDAKREARAWLERMELADRAKSEVSDLSKGMQQKVQFIATVLHRPPLLILDEPFSGLDPVNSRLFEDLIAERRREGCGVIFSTHIMEQAERLVDEVILLKKGEAVVQGPLEDVKRRHGAGWIEVRGTGCAEALRAFPGVRDERPSGPATRFRLNEGVPASDVLACLLASGARIEKFEELQASLHDIFLQRVGGIDMDTVATGERAA